MPTKLLLREEIEKRKFNLKFPWKRMNHEVEECTRRKSNQTSETRDGWEEECTYTEKTKSETEQEINL